MPTDSSNVAQLRSYLNHKARIKVSDGRIFIGLFVCTDKDKNTILAHAEEYRGGKFSTLDITVAFDNTLY
jgi:small nuclear ribonucleoprotein (snRNP)-like protein